MWNRQRTDHQETDPGDRRTSRGSVRRWNPRDQWMLSARLAHPPLISETDFVKAQTVNAVATPEDGQPRRYLLTGLIICRTCGRRADARAAATYLRANQITITCDADTITFNRQPSAVRIPRQKQRPPPEPL